MTDNPPDRPFPPFDDELAKTFVGKVILVGVTWLDENGDATRRMQMHGVIASATREGILIQLRGAYEGKRWNMPPALDAIHKARPGSYTLKETREVIEDPDFVATWTYSTSPKREDEGTIWG